MATERQSRALYLKTRRWRACISYEKNELRAASSRRERESAKYREMGERETDRGREQTWTKRENERLQRESLALKPRLKQRVPPAN